MPKTFVDQITDSPSLIFHKMMNQVDGSRKPEEKKIPNDMLSDKPCLLLCSECQQKGVRTKFWKDDSLFVCTNVDCRALYYWDGGFYYA